jgi:hypothetical protein
LAADGLAGKGDLSDAYSFQQWAGPRRQKRGRECAHFNAQGCAPTNACGPLFLKLSIAWRY